MTQLASSMNYIYGAELKTQKQKRQSHRISIGLFSLIVISKHRVSSKQKGFIWARDWHFCAAIAKSPKTMPGNALISVWLKWPSRNIRVWSESSISTSIHLYKHKKLPILHIIAHKLRNLVLFAIVTSSPKYDLRHLRKSGHFTLAISMYFLLACLV